MRSSKTGLGSIRLSPCPWQPAQGRTATKLVKCVQETHRENTAEQTLESKSAETKTKLGHLKPGKKGIGGAVTQGGCHVSHQGPGLPLEHGVPDSGKEGPLQAFRQEGRGSAQSQASQLRSGAAASDPILRRPSVPAAEQSKENTH